MLFRSARRGILKQLNCELIGAKEHVIAKAEGRESFKQAMIKIGLDVPRSFTVHNLEEARAALRGYRDNFRATEQLYQIGFGNLIEVEASRRQALVAERTVADLEQERVSAWIALYRAAGGGWNAP